eukprot:1963988-Alexandrium_andersonii.AAC.1
MQGARHWDPYGQQWGSGARWPLVVELRKHGGARNYATHNSRRRRKTRKAHNLSREWVASQRKTWDVH